MSAEYLNGHMSRNARRIPHSALYTSAAWAWGGFPCAAIVLPRGAMWLFHLVNAYGALYRLLNPAKRSLRHTLVHRHAIIDILLVRSGCRQIVEIAAGFSPRGCAVSADSAYRYCEIDQADVIALKRGQMEESVAGREVLARPGFRLLAGDIAALDFSPHASGGPTFVISEGILMYFRRDVQMEIWRGIARFLRADGGEYVFDYTPAEYEPPRSRIGQLLSDLGRRAARLPPPFAYDGRTTQDVIADLHAAGFARVEAIVSSEVARAWSLPFPDVPTNVVVFRCGCG